MTTIKIIFDALELLLFASTFWSFTFFRKFALGQIRGQYINYVCFILLLYKITEFPIENNFSTYIKIVCQPAGPKTNQFITKLDCIKSHKPLTYQPNLSLVQYPSSSSSRRLLTASW